MKKRFKGNLGGFTLIELLVVVLIIGILAAIALPQYEVTVLKAKMATVLPMMKAIKDANERYYMANGSYSDDLSVLDVELPEGKTNSIVSGHILYENGTYIDNITDASVGGDVIGGLSGAKKSCYIRMFYDHSSSPGVITCGDGNIPNYHPSASHPKCAQICKSMGY